jgi:hypothetical protein
MEITQHREPWNKGKLIGQKPPLKPKEIWAIRIQLQNEHQVRDLAMFNLAIDSKLRSCDLVNLRVRDITHGNQILPRAMVVQRKTQRPVQFELTEPTRTAVAAWIAKAKLRPEQSLFPSRISKSAHVSTRQYARIVHQWVAAIGLDPTVYGTHTMRRTKATLIYKRTKNLRAVQLQAVLFYQAADFCSNDSHLLLVEIGRLFFEFGDLGFQVTVPERIVLRVSPLLSLPVTSSTGIFHVCR